MAITRLIIHILVGIDSLLLLILFIQHWQNKNLNIFINTQPDSYSASVGVKRTNILAIYMSLNQPKNLHVLKLITIHVAGKSWN